MEWEKGVAEIWSAGGGGQEDGWCEWPQDLGDDMRVLIDGHSLGRRYGGNETFVGGLVDALSLSCGSEIALYAPAPWRTSGPVTHIHPRTDSVALQRVIDIPLVARALHANVVHTSFSVLPIAPRGVRQVVTVHDILFVKHEEMYERADLVRLKATVKHAVSVAEAIVTVSEWSKVEICDYYRISADRVWVVPNGASLGPASAAVVDAPRPSVRPFVLFVGTIQPRKGLKYLLGAMRRFADRATLVIVGRVGWLSGEEERGIDQAIREGWCVRYAAASRAHLRWLYAHAACTVVPSVAEGFGIPVLDGLVYGRFVIASDLPVFRSVFGDLPIYFPVGDVSCLGDLIEQVLEGGQRVPNERAIADLVETCSWARAASLAQSLYRKVSGT